MLNYLPSGWLNEFLRAQFSLVHEFFFSFLASKRAVLLKSEMAAAEVEMERCKAAIVQMLVRLDDDSIRLCQNNCTGKIPLSLPDEHLLLSLARRYHRM